MILSLLLIARLQAPELPKIEEDALRKDLRLAKAALEESHPGMYRYTPKAEMEAAWARAEQGIKEPMTVLQFYRLIAPAVATLKCGHTSVMPSQAAGEYLEKEKLLPLDVRFLQNGVFVLKDLTGGDAAGKQLVSINGQPIAQIMHAIESGVTADGDSLPGRRYRLHFGVLNLLLPVYGLSAPYTVELGGPTGVVEKITYEGKLAAEIRPLLIRPNRSGPKLDLKGPGGYALMTIPSFGDQSLRAFLKNSFDRLTDADVKGLIIDLRHNGGGYDELGKLLLSYLVDQPFQYYEGLYVKAKEFKFQGLRDEPAKITMSPLVQQEDGRWLFTGHPNWGEQRPSSPVFKGKVQVLVNGGSFSTTCEFLSHFKSMKRGLVIGEESGGNYYGNTSGQSTTITLPASGLHITIPHLEYRMRVDKKPGNAEGIKPTVITGYTIDELIRGADKELEFFTKTRGF